MIGIFRGGAITVLLTAFFCAGLLSAPRLYAQENQVQSLVTKVDRLQRELLDLQRSVYQGAPAPATTGGGGDLSSTQAARIELRMAQFERAQQNLTGHAEELGFAVEELSAKFDRL
jgi:hypothetical protein